MGTYDPFCGVVIPPCIDLNQLVSELMEWQDVRALVFHEIELWMRDTVVEETVLKS